MTKITNLIPLTDGQLYDPVEFAKYFLEHISSLPGKKIGFIGQPQSGTTTSMHYFSTMPNLFNYYDPRGIPDTFNGTLPHFDEDLYPVVKQQLPTWMPLIEKAPKDPAICESLDDCIYVDPDPTLVLQMVDKIANDVVESRKMLLWKSALNLFCIRDLSMVSRTNTEDSLSVYDLPYLPLEYNQYFDVLVLLKRRPNWFNDPAFLEHIESEGVDTVAEQNLVAMRDQELLDYSLAGNWKFDFELSNTGSKQELEAELVSLISNIRNKLND
jgi:hypothetical protein